MKRYICILILLCAPLCATDLFVICSCMKSGTIYLRDILATASGRQFRCHSRNATENEFGYMHEGYLGVRKDIKVVFLHRDPRDVLISYAHWGPKQPGAGHWFRENLQAVRMMDLNQRILYLLNPKNPQELCHSLPDVPARIKIAQANPDRYFVLTFEELVGTRGGGDNVKRFEALSKLRVFLNMDHITDADMVRIADNIWGRSGSFRRGQIGDWKNRFDEKLKTAFKQSFYKDFLVLLGYEKDNNW